MPTRPEPPPTRQGGGARSGGRNGPERAARAADGATNAPAKAGRRDRRALRRPSPLPFPPLAALALAIGRAGIGLELAEPLELGCIRVAELSTSLPGMRFPVDVSGGFSRFRHRRGELQSLRLEVTAPDLERWMAPKLRGLVGTRTPEVWIAIGRGKATFCVTAPATAAADAADDEGFGRAAARVLAGDWSGEAGPWGGPPIVAFDVHVLAEGDGLVLVMAHARGAGLPEPPSALAIACLEAVLGVFAPGVRRAGAVFTIDRPAALVALALFPPVGARLPSSDGVRWTALAAEGDTWIFQAARDAEAAAPTDDAVRAREVATLLGAGDDALLRGELDAARSLYLEALERAPRHPEIAGRVIEIDARMPVRAEAALATLAESHALGARGGAGTGFVTGELLAQVGDSDAAIASFERAGAAEPCPALAARAFELAARTSHDPEAAARWLDTALSLSPRSATARWARLRARLALGRLEDALADAEHLEALARGARAKFAVWLRAGRAWESLGQSPALAAHAGAIFERALRYAPDEPAALTGLGVALLSDGREARGVALLDRALEIVRGRGEAESSILLALAKALAERLDDLPTAIAHASAIPATAGEAAVARGLEGRWRARLGDLAGAALAFARLRDLAASRAPSSKSDDLQAHVIVALLLEAAAMERDIRGEPLAAQRHLAVALRILPHHVEARRAYREVGAILAAHDNAPDERDEDAAPPPEAPAAARRPAMNLALAEVPNEEEDIEKAARVDELTRRLRDDPGNDAVAGELTALLEDLRRGHELVALLTGRLEDANPERRAVLAREARALFERMTLAADAARRTSDAALYRDALDAIASIAGT